MPTGKKQIELGEHYRDLDQKNQGVVLFLEENGIRITSLDQLKPKESKLGEVALETLTLGSYIDIGDLIAIGDRGKGSLYLFPYSGIKGNNQVNFVNPRKVISGTINPDNALVITNDCWFNSRNNPEWSDKFYIGPARINDPTPDTYFERGVYKLTSPDLVQRINNLFSDPVKECKF